MTTVSAVTGQAIGIGSSSTDSQNMQLRTNNDGTFTLARGALGNLGDILTIDASGAVKFPQGIQALGNYANDGAAATGGVAINGLYRNGSIIMVRVA